jgi:hypothetical protein
MGIAPAYKNVDDLQDDYRGDEAVRSAEIGMRVPEQSGSTPSSETRFSTPLDPMIGVFWLRQLRFPRDHEAVE